ncbi:MAG: hypothetical protein WDM80_17630 [Limisphaerales bacterium]
MGEADGKFSGEFAKWDQAGEFYATLARWVSGKRQPLPDDMLLTQEIRDGICLVQLHLDPERKTDPFSTLPRVRMLHGLPDAAPAKQNLALAWKNADLLEAVIPIAGRETILNTVEIAGQQPVTLPPVCLPYSPEFAPDQPGRGAATLAQISTTTGGKERIEIPKIWDELPVKSRYVELAPWLLVMATVLFLLEVLERRTGWLSRLFRIKTATAQTDAERVEALQPDVARKPIFPWPVRKAARPKTAPIMTKSKPDKPVSSATTTSKPVSDKSISGDSAIDSLRKARERANRRTDKGQ